MDLRRHPTARCERCDSRLWYGLKSEGSGWKVLYKCQTAGCEGEVATSFIDMASVSSRDEVYERAEDIGRTL
ncbi:hypothetical protein [Halapricum desulfuricans]|uniref:Uncharacterized protein n=1 Tax=Halapricum desulfuricans TaxID=2841257 RepID=A0A897NE78_9EURY|nr:hypothetical protein [Halapricum desulfuricans]QSG08151.1 hypothetical protein HSR122_0746 [Halapricum desulfuricans]QSG12720.1 hypothetical protein HSBGL_2314 [Halapricum desulfuricans]